jgi:8-oxo-dGTP diphosphatase
VPPDGGRPGEAAWLRGYDPRSFRPFAVTVDLAVFTVRERLLQRRREDFAARRRREGGARRSAVNQTLRALLVRRDEHPYRGWWALPGGHLQQGMEAADDAARRELAEETGIDVGSSGLHLEQLGSYSDPYRDPRIAAGLQVVSLAYVALAPELPDPVAGTDAADAAWWPVGDLPDALAFDHGKILADALERLRAKLEYSTVATSLLTEPFSLAELREVYAAVWGAAPDPANFRRKVLATPGFVVPAEVTGPPTPAGGRPPELYRRGAASWIVPPLTRTPPPLRPERDEH